MRPTDCKGPTHALAKGTIFNCTSNGIMLENLKRS